MGINILKKILNGQNKPKVIDNTQLIQKIIITLDYVWYVHMTKKSIWCKWGI